MSAAKAAHSPTLILRLYLAVTAAMPFVLNRMAAKAHAKQGAAPERLAERQGIASARRPDGRLIWIHAASVGEVLSVIDLAADLRRALPHAQFLFTTMTATGADMITRRAPEGTIHQFMPADTRGATAAFLDHWKPDLAIITESDLWPRMILSLSGRGIPMALVNVRPSRSRARFPQTVAALMGQFGCITAQSQKVADDLARMGLDQGRIITAGELKADATPLPYDADDLVGLLGDIGGRPVWIAASTHADDEGPVLAAHRAARAAIPELLLVLIPRHPERADAILTQCAGLSATRRSLGEMPTTGTDIYVADTLGETGLFYRAAPLVFLGGSFGSEGGHNPFEPALLGAALLYGPKVRHFETAFAALRKAGAARQVVTGADLGTAVAQLLQGAALSRMQDAARGFMAGQSGARARTLAPILALLPPND